MANPINDAAENNVASEYLLPKVLIPPITKTKRKINWGAAAPQTPRFGWGGSAPPDPPATQKKIWRAGRNRMEFRRKSWILAKISDFGENLGFS